jgi:hypothetical protein
MVVVSGAPVVQGYWASGQLGTMLGVMSKRERLNLQVRTIPLKLAHVSH